MTTQELTTVVSEIALVQTQIGTATLPLPVLVSILQLVAMGGKVTMKFATMALIMELGVLQDVQQLL